MTRIRRLLPFLGLLLSGAVTSCGYAAEEKKAEAPKQTPTGYTDTPFLPDGKWRVHDANRPAPVAVTPGTASTPEQPGLPPSDAVVLFNGKDLSAWQLHANKKNPGGPAAWKVENGYMEVVKGAGTIETKESFGDCQLHIEWASPSMPQGEGQKRGNSGVIFMGRYEVQVLDSFNSVTYADGQAAAVYCQYPPLVNACRGPGEWQTYDIVFEAPRFEGEKLVKNAYVTVIHNGVLVHNHRKILGPMGHRVLPPYKAHPPEGPLVLQDHGDPVRFRNIWVRRLKSEDETAPPPAASLPRQESPFATVSAKDEDNPNQWSEFEGKDGPGKGKHVVLISGDEEYRSEEACPMLAKILAARHGFRCTVLYAIDPKRGIIDATVNNNIPGLSALESADLMVIATRFRELPDEQMKYIVDYVNSGKPIIGLRTATHAFNYAKNKNSKYVDWGWNNKNWAGGFGQQVLGETWVSHHGKHKFEATRGVVNKDQASNPILRGVDDVFGPSDVYGVTHLPKEADVLLFGQVLTGMKPEDPPVKGAKNDPMMPLAWTKTFTGSMGKASRVFCTTMGAAVDFESEGLRRLIVNAVYWGVGLENQIPDRSNVEYVGEYRPSFYGFLKADDWRIKGLRPDDFEAASKGLFD